MKTKSAPFFVLSSVFLFITAAIYLVSRNAFIYPDSFVYDAIVRANWHSSFILNGFAINPDIFTILKPFSSLYVSFVMRSGIPAIIFNVFWAISGTIVLYMSLKRENEGEYPLMHGLSSLLLFIFTNGIMLYWISRAGAEYITFFCIALLIWSIKYKERIFPYIIAIFLIFLRTELLFVLPLLTYRRSPGKNNKNAVWAAIIASSTVILGTVSFFNNELLSFITHIFIPLAISSGLSLVIEHELPARINWSFGKLMGRGLLMFLAAAVILVIINRYSGLGLQLANVIFLLPILSFAPLSMLALYFIRTKETSRETIHYWGIIILLSAAYIFTAPDSFRYFIFVLPFLAIIIGKYIITQLPKERLPELAAIGLQIALLLLFVPFSLLGSNYWINRYMPVKNASETIFSSTPIMSVYLEKETRDICLVQSLQETGYYFIDGYAKYRCREKITSLEEELNVKARKINTIYENSIVNLERFNAENDTTMIYYYSPISLQ